MTILQRPDWPFEKRLRAPAQHFPSRENLLASRHGKCYFTPMRIIARNKLVAFWTMHPETEASLKHWHEVATSALWQSPLDVVADFSKAKTLNGERVRFEVAGGDYRLVVAFDWRRSIAFIKFIGTHADYDKIDALTVNLF